MTARTSPSVFAPWMWRKLSSYSTSSRTVLSIDIGAGRCFGGCAGKDASPRERDVACVPSATRADTAIARMCLFIDKCAEPGLRALDLCEPDATFQESAATRRERRGTGVRAEF